MKIRIANDDIQSVEVRRLERVSGEDVKRCYQCGNCSGGCPVSYAMEIPPTKVMRFLQLGNIEDVREANTMWLCVGCLHVRV